MRVREFYIRVILYTIHSVSIFGIRYRSFGIHNCESAVKEISPKRARAGHVSAIEIVNEKSSEERIAYILIYTKT